MIKRSTELNQFFAIQGGNMNQKVNPVRALFLASVAATATAALCVGALAWLSAPNTAQAREWQQPNAPDSSPAIGNLVPTTTQAGGPSLVITLSNSSFLSNAITYVAWNGVALSTTIVDTTTLSAIVPAANISLPNNALVTIVDTGGFSNGEPFAVITPTLVVSGVSPISATAGASATLVLTGDGFYAGTIAQLNGITLTTTPLSSTEASALLPSNTFTVVGSYTLTVKNPGGTPAAFAFSIVAGPLAQLAVAPSAISLATSTTQTFAASGADVYGNPVTPISVTWSANPSAGSINNAGLFTSGVTAGIFPGAVVVDGAITGTASVTVVATPVISSVSPITLTAGQSETLTITGTNLTSTTLAQLGNLTLTLVISGNQATAIVPSNTITVAGNVTLTLINVGAPATTTLLSVLPGPLGQITVSPNPATVTLGGSQAFSATGKDAFGNVITGLTFTWGISGAGQIDAAGNYTASTVAGLFNVLASRSNITGSAIVNVLAGPSAFIAMTATPAVLVSNGVSTTTVVAAVTDSFGNAVGAGRLVTFSTSSGVITPLVGSTNSQGRASATLTKTLTSPTSTIASVIKVSALTNGAGGLVISQTLMVSTIFTPLKTYHPIVFKEAPLVNTSACAAFTVTTGMTVSQATTALQIYYRFVTTSTTQAVNITGFASTGSVAAYTIVSDASCGSATPTMIVNELGVGVPILGPGLQQLRYNGLTPGGKYLVVISASMPFALQPYTLRLVP
jgi:Bacterial Ig-like domain (group 1)/IPT/TIG domain